MYDPELYRTKAEVEEWRERDPIDGFVRQVTGDGLLDDDEVAAVEAEVADELAGALAEAESGHPEPVEDLTRFVTSEVGS
jgi:pyruvate dehydrogenase E1 component alpha subunit